MAASDFEEEAQGSYLSSELLIRVEYFGHTLKVPIGCKYLTTSYSGEIYGYEGGEAPTVCRDEGTNMESWRVPENSSTHYIDGFLDPMSNWRDSLMEVKRV